MSQTLSMTGFASESRTNSFGRATVEVRSVNHRYLDITVKLPDFLKHGEIEVRNEISRTVKRGKIECKVTWEDSEDMQTEILSENKIRTLKNMQKKAMEIFGNTIAPLSVNELLRWPGVIDVNHVDSANALNVTLEAAAEAVNKLNKMRETEGKKLETLCLAKSAEIIKITKKVELAVPVIREKYKKQLLERLAQLEVNETDNRLQQELVIHASKLDINEELERLEVHAESIKDIFKEASPKGKKLDFLMQELNREANTLGSKSVDIDTTQASMDLKIVIEQIREQIQNIE